jgi:hypothetical protein
MANAKVREQCSLRANPCSKGDKKGFVVQSFQSWWVVVFISFCGFTYYNSIAKKNEVLAALDSHLAALCDEKASLLEEKEDLLLQINSQSDPAWIQLTLMKGLGLVPEGQLKVYFSSEN